MKTVDTVGMRSKNSVMWKRALACCVVSLLWIGLLAVECRADEGGVSFWLPGSYGSLTATPQTPGWSLATVYYHTSVSAGGDVAISREITIGNINPIVNVSTDLRLESDVDLFLFNPNYVLKSPVLGGQLAIGITAFVGRNETSLDGTLTLSAGDLIITRQGTLNSSLDGVGDLFPKVSLRWNSGIHNYMTYVTGDIPVGDYDSTRLANLGIGHGAFDGGFGYTYFDPTKGHEFSALAGLTYNFENPDTGYQNGVDFHLEWGASQFLSKQLQVGIAGYFYDQVSGDSGGRPILGDFESRVAAVGPQIGYLFPIGKLQGYVNLKGYWEFAAKNRAEGWNVWLTFALMPPAPPHPAPAKTSAK